MEVRNIWRYITIYIMYIYIYQFEIYEYVFIYIIYHFLWRYIYLKAGKSGCFLCHVGVNGTQNQYLVVSLGPPSKDTTTYTVYVYLKPN